jgi:hypothetical protein
MVKRLKFATVPNEHSKAIYGYWDKAGKYVSYEDFEKLLKLSESMLEDLIGEGMHTQKHEDEMKLIRGDYSLADLHASIMQPVIERCKKALEATNEPRI